MNHLLFFIAAVHLYRIPEEWTFSAHILRHVLGGLMVVLHCWTSWSTYVVLGEFGWFYGDFFPVVTTPHLSYTGIYRYLNDPEKIVGQAAYFGLALIAYSPHVLALALLAFATNTLFLEYVEGPHMRRVYGGQVRDESGVSKNVKRVPGVIFMEQIGEWILHVFRQIERHVYLHLEKIVHSQAQPCPAVGGIKLQKTLVKMAEPIPFVLDNPHNGNHICVLKDGVIIATLKSCVIDGCGEMDGDVSNSDMKGGESNSDMKTDATAGSGTKSSVMDNRNLKGTFPGSNILKNNALVNSKLTKSNSSANGQLKRSDSATTNLSAVNKPSASNDISATTLSFVPSLLVPWMTGTFQLSTADCTSEPFTITPPEYNSTVLEQMAVLLQSVSLTLDGLTNLAADHPIFKRLAEAIDSLYGVELAPMTIFRLCSDPTRLQAHIATARDIFANV
jgi:hypothetical protein